MNKSLTIGLATRTRPGLLARTINETLHHAKETDTRLIILADDDDKATQSLRNKLTDKRIIWSIEPKPDSLGTKYNRMIKVRPADVYLSMVDYAPHMTDGFDTEILAASNVYSDGYAFIINYFANFSFSQINAITAKAADKMGGIYPELFPYWFVDHWFQEVAKRVGREVFAPVYVDCSRKQPTIGLRDSYFWGQVFGLTAPERVEIANKILGADDFKVDLAENGVALRRNWALLEQWSWLINESLDKDQPREDGDEAYNRLVQKALAIVKPRQKAQEAETERALAAQKAA